VGVQQVLELAGQFGPMGLMVAYFVWRDTRDDKLREADTCSREKLAGTLALLTAVIQGRGGV
jgi:hypothetical protein